MRPTTLVRLCFTAAVSAVVLACQAKDPIGDWPRGRSDLDPISEVSPRGGSGPISDWPERDGHTADPETDDEASESEAVVPSVDKPSEQNAPGQAMAGISVPPNPSGAASPLDAGAPLPSGGGLTQPDADTAETGGDAGEDAGAAEAGIDAASAP